MLALVLAQIGLVNTATVNAGLGTALTVTPTVSTIVCVHEPKGNLIAITDIVVFVVKAELESVMFPPVPRTAAPVLAPNTLSYN